MFNRILVPTDFSKASDAALAYARMLGGGAAAIVHLLHVIDDAQLAATSADPRHDESAACEKLQQRLRDDGPGSILVVQRSKTPADAIARYARRHDIDLIVMGAHGRRRAAHLQFGSVAGKVSRTATCPVLTVREMPRMPGGRPRILVATDFSPCADAALDYARRMAARTRGSICLLHVIDRLASSVASGSKLGATEPLEARQDRSEIARIELGRRMLADSRSRIAITGDIVFGAGATTIAAYAADHAFDLIVMGTRGHGGIPHLVMGSVAEAVIRTARCPVLTVKSASAAQRQEVTAEPAYAGV